jgi:hypothetical protein
VIAAGDQPPELTAEALKLDLEMARSSGFAAAATPAKNEGHRSARRVVRMSHVNKSNSRSPGARSKRRKMAEPDDSKMEHERELSAGPRAPNTQWETHHEGKGLMATEVKSCATHNTLNTAAQTMWDNDIGCVPVVDNDRRVVGMLTDRDVCMYRVK